MRDWAKQQTISFDKFNWKFLKEGDVDKMTSIQYVIFLRKLLLPKKYFGNLWRNRKIKIRVKHLRKTISFFVLNILDRWWTPVNSVFPWEHFGKFSDFSCPLYLMHGKCDKSLAPNKLCLKKNKSNSHLTQNELSVLSKSFCWIINATRPDCLVNSTWKTAGPFF